MSTDETFPESLDDVQPLDTAGGPDPESVSTAASNRLDTLQSPRPAQDKLHQDQQAFVTKFVQEGYQSRRDALVALQELGWLSMGRIKPNWYAIVGRDDVTLSVLITSENRRRYRSDPVPLAAAKQQRRRLAKKFLRPACRLGFAEIQRDAAEYVEEDNEVRLEDVSMFAMRPTLQLLKNLQEVALTDFLSGFTNELELDQWLHEFDRVALTQQRRVEGDLDWRIEMEPGAQRVLLGGNGGEARRREDMAAYYVLPALGLAPPIALDHAQEHREESDESFLSEFDMGAPSGGGGAQRS
jgi:hypothetical protein